MSAPQKPLTVRFAPSPTGTLHLGNARTALFNYLLARGNDGQLILRIEDTDKVRSTKESETSILEDLRWLGIAWDFGPDKGGPTPPYRQSEADAYYGQLFERLRLEGKVYPCFCTPADLEAERERQKLAGGAIGYNGKCRQLESDIAAGRVHSGEKHVWRLKFPADRSEIGFNDAVRGQVIFPLANLGGDMVIFRGDGSPIFHFAVVADDIRMGISMVLRGEDHLANTPKQLMLYEALGATPPVFGHMAMILGPDKTKLSKRHGGVSVEYYRQRGILPEALFNYLSLLGWSPGDDTEFMLPAEIVRRFSIDRLVKSAAVFDEKKLLWLNGMHLRVLAPDDFVARASSWLEVFAPDTIASVGRELCAQILPIYREAIESFAALPAELLPFGAVALADPAELKSVLSFPSFVVALNWIEAHLAELPAAGAVRDEWLTMGETAVQAESGAKGKQLFQPFRVLISGRTSGRALPDVLRYMPKRLIEARIAELRKAISV